MATHVSLWLDIWDQFAEEHLEEWEAQKFQGATLNDLKRDTEAMYRAPIIKKQDMTRHAPIVRRQLHRSCHLNDERLVQKGRPVPRPLKWM